MRDQSPEVCNLVNCFMDRYRSLTPQIPPENILAFSKEGEKLLNQLPNALVTAQLAAA